MCAARLNASRTSLMSALKVPDTHPGRGPVGFNLGPWPAALDRHGPIRSPRTAGSHPVAMVLRHRRSAWRRDPRRRHRGVDPTPPRHASARTLARIEGPAAPGPRSRTAPQPCRTLSDPGCSVAARLGAGALSERSLIAFQERIGPGRGPLHTCLHSPLHTPGELAGQSHPTYLSVRDWIHSAQAESQRTRRPSGTAPHQLLPCRCLRHRMLASRRTRLGLASGGLPLDEPVEAPAFS